MTRHDAIAIGSGMGGLTVAAIMARLKGWRVLALERHFRAGGCSISSPQAAPAGIRCRIPPVAERPTV